jgi:hypothetical protein
MVKRLSMRLAMKLKQAPIYQIKECLCRWEVVVEVKGSKAGRHQSQVMNLGSWAGKLL